MHYACTQWSVLFVASHLFSIANCIRWYMTPNTLKCLREELRENVLVVGTYEVTPVHGQQIDYVVKDSNDHILSQEEDIKSGKFTFSVETYDYFEICFKSKGIRNQIGVLQEIFLDIKTGTEAKSYEKVDEVEMLKPLEMDLKRLEDLSQEIVLGFDDMKKRAKEMRSTNKSTNRRLFYFGICSMICLITLATWQVFYLRRYFKAKKLIE